MGSESYSKNKILSEMRSNDIEKILELAKKNFLKKDFRFLV